MKEFLFRIGDAIQTFARRIRSGSLRRLGYHLKNMAVHNG
jgi:hypothetical protein